MDCLMMHEGGLERERRMGTAERFAEGGAVRTDGWTDA